MSLGFRFDNAIDPHKPLNPEDPPPRGWDTGIDNRDYRKALFSVPGELFTECVEWEKRELTRCVKDLRKKRREVRKKNPAAPKIKKLLQEESRVTERLEEMSDYL